MMMMSASEMTYIVSGGALNSTHSLNEGDNVKAWRGLDLTTFPVESTLTIRLIMFCSWGKVS